MTRDKTVQVPPVVKAALIVFVVALVVRLAFVVDDVHSAYLAHRLIDEQDYHDLATRFLEGTWPGNEAIFRPPLYPMFLAAIYRLLSNDVLTVRLVQMSLGSFAAPLTTWIAHRVLASQRAALAAGLIVALCGPLVFYDAQLLAASLDVLLVLTSVALVLRADARGHAIDWGIAGVVIGVAATNRGTMLLVVPVVALWAFVTRDRATPVLPLAFRLGVFAAAAALMVSPLAWHNARYDDRPQHEYAEEAPPPPSEIASVGVTFGRLATWRFSALGWADGINLYIGNVPDVAELNRDSNAEHFDWFNNLTGEPWRHGARTAHEHSAWFARETRSFALTHTAAWFTFTAHKALEVVNGYEVPRGVSPYAEREQSNVLAALMWSGPLRFPSGLLLPLGIVGAFALRRNRRAALVALVMITYLLFTVVFFVTSRYRLPALPLAAVLASGFVARVLERPRESIAATAIALAMIVVSNLRLAGQSFDRSAIETFDLARELVDEGNGDAAIPFTRASIAKAPTFAQAHVLLGFLLNERGDGDAALAEYRIAIAVKPTYAPAHFNLGGLLYSRGDACGALDAFEEAKRLKFRDARLDGLIARARARASALATPCATP